MLAGNLDRFTYVCPLAGETKEKAGSQGEGNERGNQSTS